MVLAKALIAGLVRSIATILQRAFVIITQVVKMICVDQLQSNIVHFVFVARALYSEFLGLSLVVVHLDKFVLDCLCKCQLCHIV